MGKQAKAITVRSALETVGGLSAPSKMPSYGWSLPAQECATGSSLREVKGSVCEGCYAMRGRYTFDNVQSALYRRLDKLREALASDYQRRVFVGAFRFLLVERGLTEFRWHDSGDLQSEEHLGLIAEIARATPRTKHWLPTREYRIVLRYLQQGNEIPENLNIRLSAHMVDGPVPSWAYKYGLTTSGVSSEGGDCHAQEVDPTTGRQYGTCGPCRKCWDKNVTNVTYHKH